jgi:hypothetical protein
LITITVTETGVSLKKLADDTKKIAAVTVAETKDYALKRGEQLTPRISGLMSQSWYATKRSDLEYEISNRAPYFLYFIMGTAPHQIRPRFASVLRFEVGGQTIFTKLVNHPGTKPHDLLSKLADEVKAEIPQFFYEAFEEEGYK